MNKIESGILKGIGIVMMLFHHLFVLPKDTCLIDSLIMIGDVPAVHKLALIMSPVYIFFDYQWLWILQKISDRG